MNYVHPSAIKPEHGKTYIVFIDGPPQIAVWRKEMGDFGKGGAFCTQTFVRGGRRFDLISKEIILCAELPPPTQAQCSAADAARRALHKEEHGPVSHAASGEQL